MMDDDRLKSLFLDLIDEREPNEIKVDRTKDSNVLLIDGLNTFFRTWSVNPTMNENGDHMGGLVGFLRSIGVAIRTVNPTRCVIVWDGRGGSDRRRKLLPEYKANRKPNRRLNRTYADMMNPEQEEDSMRRQVSSLLYYLKCLPVTTISIDNIEADDVLAYLANEVFKENVTISSTDEDFMQLVNDRISVFNPYRKIIYTPEVVYKEYGIHSKNVLLYRIFSGDKSDKIDGIKGVGLKSLIKRMPFIAENKKFTIEDIYDYANKNTNQYKFFQEIIDNKDKLYRNKILMQLDDVDISGINKLNILNIMTESKPKLNKSSFIKGMVNDGISDSFKNFHEWIRDTFLILDKYNER